MGLRGPSHAWVTQFDGLICRLPVSADEDDEVFPWQRIQNWVADEDHKDFLVPCHDAPDKEGHVALTGLSGEHIDGMMYKPISFSMEGELRRELHV